MSDIDELKRRAGITEWIDGGEQTGEANPEAIATTFINGNQSDAFRATQDTAMFAKVVLVLKDMDQNAMMTFLNMAANRG